MIKPETSLADVRHGASRFPLPLALRLRAGGVASVADFLRMTERSITLAFPDVDGSTAVRRWRGRIRQQLRKD